MFCKNVSAPRTFTSQFPKNLGNLDNISMQSLNQKFKEWMQKYEDFVGLTEVMAAHNRVLEVCTVLLYIYSLIKILLFQAEMKFVKSQEERQEAQREISANQSKLQDLHAELDRIPIGDDKFLGLITQKHAIIKEERRLKEEFKLFEKNERENFAALSHTVRDSHEKERAQAEKTKYWSIIGSILGTMLGIFGTTINNRLRMKELRSLVEEATVKNNSTFNVEEVKNEVIAVIKQHIVSDPSKGITVQELPQEKWNQLEDSFSEISKTILRNHEVYLQQHQKLESLLVLKNANDNYENSQKHFVIAEPDIKDLFSNQTEDFRRLITITSIMVPICTWALCRFLNFWLCIMKLLVKE